MQTRRSSDAYADRSWTFDAVKARPIIDLVIRSGGWAKNEHVVEIGAGMGHYSEQLRRRGFDVTALETDADMVARARRLYPRLVLEQTPARHLHPGRPVDHVYVREPVLSDDVEAQVEHVFEWLRPGGTLVAQIHTDDPAAARRQLRLVERFGQVVAFSDWSGAPIRSGVRHDRGVVMATRVSPLRGCARDLFEEGISRVRRSRTG